MRGDPVHCFDKECNAPTVNPCDFVEVDDHRLFCEFGRHADYLASPLVRGLRMTCRHRQIEWMPRTSPSPPSSKAVLQRVFGSQAEDLATGLHIICSNGWRPT